MSVWTDRDEPVLRWLLENPPQGGVLRIWGISGLGHGDAPFGGIPSLTQAQVYLAIETLRDAGYLASLPGEWSTQGGYAMTQIQVTGSGKQVLGLWPRFDVLESPGKLAAILEGLADNAPTEEEASNLKTAAKTVRSAVPAVLRGLAEAGLSAAARHLLGL
jgi:hypothetical protein